ncbi:SH2 domain-containing adapter protein E [Diachasma alloeum]|uniref:SH2 domain-containing adapter protein E n=1 Tax=Diachasma alloeum TaxID=454923 RepID=UPI0007384DE4|nr:SH2 domain-containing adapter protein E [Diachasma alloeum]
MIYPVMGPHSHALASVTEPRFIHIRVYVSCISEGLRVPSDAERNSVSKSSRAQRIGPQLPVLLKYDPDVERGGDEADGEEEEADEVEDIDDLEMARQRRVYETAFDCKVTRSDDDLDEIDRVTNHPVLHLKLRGTSPSCSSPDTTASKYTGSQWGKQQTHEGHKQKMMMLQPKPVSNRQQPHLDNIYSLAQGIQTLKVNSSDEQKFTGRITTCRCTSSLSSTAPLSAKFHGNQDDILLNIHSAPNLPLQTDRPRLRGVRPPIESLRIKDSPKSSTDVFDIKSRTESFVKENNDYRLRKGNQELILEFKGRPRGDKYRPRCLVRVREPVGEFKESPHEAEGDLLKERTDPGLVEFKLRPTRCRVGYSSTESMATSSSAGSMESLRSTTSESNRSTSSSDSRRSTSLSSHSSDSGTTHCFLHHHHQPKTLSGYLTFHASHLHILSPISDKSSQEPASETSDNNRNNNSQKASPEATGLVMLNTTTNPITSTVVVPTDPSFKNRRTPQNKNVINLALKFSSLGDAEIQGSDSGISIESRAEIKCKPFAFQLRKTEINNINLVSEDPDLPELPFDMPKLRRRRLLMQQDATTSGSATSVDLRDLPFDMPKLKRRLRCTQAMESSVSRASSSISSRDVEAPPFFGGGMARPKMTLSLDGKGNSAGNEIGQEMVKKPGELNLFLPPELPASRSSVDFVDVQLPLERQRWYHGSITRIEAELVLRLLREGSYLVRNSESTKQNYSLSLKSVRGFMHMRIQKNDELNSYILGQFSKPFDSIPEMVHHFSVNRLPIRGAEHMCLLHPAIAQLL